jgi:16S rRNA (uracil1498-N3)-methyltransferase
MPRFYVSQPRIENGRLRVEGDEVKHIRKVLRLKAGDEIVVFDDTGKEYEGRIVEEGPSSVEITVQNMFISEKESHLGITLAQSLLKGEKMDYLIQKATELGVKEIVPFLSSRAIPRVEKTNALKRHRRWKKIAVEASKQCGRGVVPRIEPLQDYSGIVQNISPDFLRLVLLEKEGARLKETLEGSKEKKQIFFIVGPEGGLTPEEVGLAKQNGFAPVTLGKRILRAETASLCFLSILQYEWGDIG